MARKTGRSNSRRVGGDGASPRSASWHGHTQVGQGGQPTTPHPRNFVNTGNNGHPRNTRGGRSPHGPGAGRGGRPLNMGNRGRPRGQYNNHRRHSQHQHHHQHHHSGGVNFDAGPHRRQHNRDGTNTNAATLPHTIAPHKAGWANDTDVESEAGFLQGQYSYTGFPQRPPFLNDRSPSSPTSVGSDTTLNNSNNINNNNNNNNSNNNSNQDRDHWGHHHSNHRSRKHHHHHHRPHPLGDHDDDSDSNADSHGAADGRCCKESHALGLGPPAPAAAPFGNLDMGVRALNRNMYRALVSALAALAGQVRAWGDDVGVGDGSSAEKMEWQREATVLVVDRPRRISEMRRCVVVEDQQQQRQRQEEEHQEQRQQQQQQEQQQQQQQQWEWEQQQQWEREQEREQEREMERSREPLLAAGGFGGGAGGVGPTALAAAGVRGPGGDKARMAQPGEGQGSAPSHVQRSYEHAQTAAPARAHSQQLQQPQGPLPPPLGLVMAPHTGPPSGPGPVPPFGRGARDDALAAVRASIDPRLGLSSMSHLLAAAAAAGMTPARMASRAPPPSRLHCPSISLASSSSSASPMFPGQVPFPDRVPASTLPPLMMHHPLSNVLCAMPSTTADGKARGAAGHLLQQQQHAQIPATSQEGPGCWYPGPLPVPVPASCLPPSLQSHRQDQMQGGHSIGGGEPGLEMGGGDYLPACSDAAPPSQHVSFRDPARRSDKGSMGRHVKASKDKASARTGRMPSVLSPGQAFGKTAQPASGAKRQRDRVR